MAHYQLGSICKIISGSTPKTGIPEFWDGDKKWITPAELNESDYIIYDTERKLTQAGIKSASLSLIPKGTVLLSSRAPIGKVAIAGCDMYCNQGFKNLICSDVIYNKYLFWYLKSKTTYLNSLGRGATFKEISKTTVSNIEIDVPEMALQVTIVQKLDKCQTVIRHRRTQLAKLNELVKARFVELFGDCKTNPMKWRTKELGKIACVGSSKRVFIEELLDSGIPFYRGTEVGALAEGKTITPELFISETHYHSLCKATGKPTIGDLLMPSICPDGRIWLVDSDSPFYFKDGRVLWVHDIQEQFNPIFLQYTLKDRLIVDYDSIASGTTFAELKIFSLKACKIFDVPLKLQNQFADFVQRVDKLRIDIQKSLDETQKLFDSLMQKYFD